LPVIAIQFFPCKGGFCVCWELLLITVIAKTQIIRSLFIKIICR